MLKTYLDLFMAFLRPGIFTFGGGPSAIPLIQNEVVNNYHFFTIDEFSNVLALANSLPGPIATKLATVVGYKVAGIIGALISLLAAVGPTSIAIILLFGVYVKFKDAAWLKAMMRAVKPVVVIMVAQSALTMAFGCSKDIYSLLLAVAAGVALYFDVNPAIIILASFIFGIIFLRP